MSKTRKDYEFSPDITLPADAGDWNRRRMTAGETSSFIRVYAAQDSWDTAMDDLKRRVDSTEGCKQAAATASAMIHKAFQLLLRTMDKQQVLSLKRNLAHMRHEVFITGATGFDHTKRDGVWVSEGDLAVIVDATRECCDTCTANIAEQRQCKLAKALDSIPRLVGDDTNTGRGCRYFDNWYKE